MKRAFATIVASSIIIGVAAGCPETNGGEPAPTVEQPPVRPRVLLELERGVISATGAAREDALTFTSNLSGSVRIVLGRDCQGSELFDSREIERGASLQYSVSAQGALAEEGEHAIHACFTDQVGQTARSTVLLRVDNTPPRVVPTPGPGSYCGRQYIAFYCADCAVIGYSSEPGIGFDDQGGVTGGSRYLVEIPVTGEPTIYYRGIDRAGNQSAEESASYVTIIGQIAVTAIEHPVISGNFASTVRSTMIGLGGEPEATFQIRRATSCLGGTILATGSLDEAGVGSVEIDAGLLFLGDNELRVCATSPAGCHMETELSLRRKDTALGWTPEPAAGSAWPACEAEVFFRFRDDAVVAAPEEIGFAIRINGSTMNPEFRAEMMDEGLLVALEAECLPDGTRVDFDLAAGGFRDEAGNPLPASWTYVFTEVADEFLPFGAKSFIVTGDVVEDEATGLFWQRCVIGQSAGCTGAGTTQTWLGAHTRCYALGNAELGGRRDWRLPSARELAGILDPAAIGAPLLNPPELDSGGLTGFWTATRPSQYADPFVQRFDTGEMAQEWQSNWRGIRCVAGRPEGAERVWTRMRWEDGQFLEDASGPIVHDSVSGLYWELQPSSAIFTDAEAVDACSGAIHGPEGWQIPTAAHLVTLFHFDGTPRIGRAPFLPAHACYWLSPLDSRLCLQPSSGGVTSVALGVSRPVWCVHEGP